MASLVDKQSEDALFTLNELDTTVEWCIFHEGCNVFSVPAGRDQIDDEMRPIQQLRTCYMEAEHHNQHAQDLIRNANDALLGQITTQVAAAIPSTYDLRTAFWWVSYHEGCMVQFRLWNAEHNFSAIRELYHEKQNHNPNARNLLAAVNNRCIYDLVNSMLELTAKTSETTRQGRVVQMPALGKDGPFPFEASQQSQAVYSVEYASLTTLSLNGKRIVLITAYGMVPTAGWSRGRLQPFRYLMPPIDGMWEFLFVADPPLVPTSDVWSHISGSYVWTLGQNEFNGVRVHSATNTVEEKVSKSEPVVLNVKHNIGEKAA